MGRPGNATRLMVGLHYLKHTFDESDESVVARWLENPYWQYFCGYHYMQHEFPLHPTSLVKWRQRVGADRMEVLLAETLATARRQKYLKPAEAREVIVDTTVQEKAIAYPTDARLYYKSIRRLIRLAKRYHIPLRQSYVRVSKREFFQQGRYARARQYQRSGRHVRKLKTYLGRLIRDIERKGPQSEKEVAVMLERTKSIHARQKDDKHKLYSLDAPEVEGISKGKTGKRYEFGCKVSVSITHKGNWVTSATAFHGNPYDGHTLADTLAKSELLSGQRVEKAYVDQGYRQHDYLGSAVIYQQGRPQKTLSAWFKKKLRRRSAIEPSIGHLKDDNRMRKNHLKGEIGDKINAILAAAGYNMRKLLAAFLYALWKWLADFIERPAMPIIKQTILCFAKIKSIT